MDVTLKRISTLDDALDLTADLDRYVTGMMAELRDEPPPEGTGERLLRRVLDSPEGVVLVAHRTDGGQRIGQRIGLCVTGPLVDPLVGDSMPMVIVLEVHPHHRHGGLARKMVGAVHRELAGRGIHTLAARAGYNDDALISIGEHMGFVRSYEVLVRE